MFRRVAEADAYLPAMPANREFVAGKKALVLAWQARYAAVVGAATAFKRGATLGIEAMCAELAQHRLIAVAGNFIPDRMRSQVLAERHQYRRSGPLLQPSGKADVIRVKMGDDDAPDPPTTGGRCQATENCLPTRLNGFEREASVDDRPPCILFEQPEIDMVERER